MTDHFKERSTRDYHTKQFFSKEELEARESLCVHEEPPFCSAACPLRLDVRELTRLAASGDLAGARALIEKQTPFPEILSAGCPAPCEAACRLGETGESLSIRAIERAALRRGAARTGRGLLKFKKKKTAAVFGGDLFALAAAGELANKSYPTTLYTEAPDAKALIDSCAPYLAAAERDATIARLKRSDIKLRFGETLEPAFLEGEASGYDLVCISADLVGGSGKTDPVTLTDERGFIVGRRTDDCLTAFYDARRAGVTADRLAQGLDPHTSRGDEGAVPSRLYTDLTDVTPSERVRPAGEEHGDNEEDLCYTADEAVREASRCIQCTCEECLKACPYLRHYKKSPRTMTREIYNNTGIIMGDHIMNGAINSCALCGQCSATCPNGFDLGEICRLARENMVETQKMSLAVHEFALLDMLFSNGEGFLCRLSPKAERTGGQPYVYFPGCQAAAVSPEAVLKTWRDLDDRLEGGAGLVLGCCGAIARWAGRKEMYEEQRSFLTEEMRKLGSPVLVAGCPTCLATLREDYPFEAVGLWDVLLEIGLPEGAGRASGGDEPGRVIIHDSCGARQDPGTRSACRELVRRLGYEVAEGELSNEKTMCCGYGGLVSYADREMASEMTRACLEEEPGGFYATYCMACRDRFERQGAKARHLTELIYDVTPGDPPDISKKRRNRLWLKETVLESVWGESPVAEDMGFDLTISDEARREMDDRMILDSDVRRVMAAYRESGEAVLDKESGLLITRFRIGNVTFWVKFTEREGGYDVAHAYSHRMTVRTR